jgi:DNA-binding winged helix-turn-helix (wHTH) protein
MVYFGPFEYDGDNKELRRDGAPVPLERQPSVALDVLVSRAGRLVPRDDLRRAIWPDDVHVDFERGMNYCIRQLRAALDDDARAPRFIETIPRQGYRFVAPVQPARAVTTRAPRPRPTRRIAAAAILLSALAGGVYDRQFAGPSAKAAHHAAAAHVLHAVHAALF